MSMLDEVIAAVTPPESEEARAQGRQKARSLAGDNDWLSRVLTHHEQLATLLTGHSVAEEAV